MVRLAIINKEKCKPTACGHECKKYCPVEKKEKDSCVTIGGPAQGVPSSKGDRSQSLTGKSQIDENTCVGCSICVKRCPFGAIDIVNLPSVNESDLVHRYGQNGFALYGLPTPRIGTVLGLLGRNGIGKTTAVNILAGHEKMNLGHDEASEEEIKSFFKGNEILKHFEGFDKKKVAYKPQNLSKLSVDVTVRDLLHQRGESGEIRKLAEHMGIAKILDNKMNKLSGGELQKVAILAASLGDDDIFFYDEPLAYLDIAERLRVSDFIKEISTGSARSTPNALSSGATTIVVEHDLLILDYFLHAIIFVSGTPPLSRMSFLD